jgi:uncharacterized radical SAM superfamily Fe-S cluster-containing enzyme
VERKGRQLFLRLTCAEHGESSACIASDARFYSLAQGKQENRCCGGGTCSTAAGEAAGSLGKNVEGRGSNPIEVLSTCLALIEIVNSCNLSCPICCADSPIGIGS